MHPKIDKTISRLVELWPLILVAGAGLVGGIRLYDYLEALKVSQTNWQSSSEVRRNHDTDEKEDIRRRLTILETNQQWLMRGK